MIKFENVNVTMQGKRILSDINLEIQDGEFVLICGESGCGKTTMTKLINGLIPHFVRDVSVDGTITVCGKNVAEMPMYEIAELVGSVFQNPKTQFFYTNSNAEMAFGLENRGVEPEYIRKRIKNTINELDIEKLEDRDVFSMSGGEKQLLAFASVYVMNPQIYVLDEPSANLDIAAMEKLSERMKVIKEKGHTVVVAEHRLAWIQKFADRIIYMKEGRIEQEFTSDEFKALSDLKRKQMGLRSIVPEQIQIPEITGNSEDAVLQIYNLSCKRKKQMIFQNISLSARTGDIIGITGKNGAGKSTFCNCLCGLLKPKGGEILYQGKKLSEKARTKLFGMVMQEVNHQLFSDSVKNECLLANEEASEQEIRELLEKFDLEEYAEYHPMILSGGQRQRLAICQAVMGEKKLLIFDEPTSGLDFRHMCQVEKMMKRLAEEKAERERKAAEEAARKRVSGAFGKGAQMTGNKGTAASGTGTEGSKEGNSSTGAKTGTGGYGTFDLGGRSLGTGSLPKPVYNVQEEGRVVVNITVNPAGQVISTSISPQTNTVNSALRKAAEDAAKKARFNTIDGVNNQTGTITYYFNLR